MDNIFTLYLHAGLLGGVIILLILLLRLLLRKAPRNVLCILWLLAAVRLLLPVQLSSPVSLQPDIASNIVLTVEQSPAAPVTDQQPNISVTPTPAPAPSAQQTPNYGKLLSGIWLIGIGIMLLYAFGSYLSFKHKVRNSALQPDGTNENPSIPGAFLLGYFRPKIYLPTGIAPSERQFVIAHERSHIARGDHLWKLLGYICACIHWYNPLVWLAYILLCRDIEIACDERVVRNMTLDERKAYSFALLNCGKRVSGVAACPMAFGEINLTQRIKNVLSYRKPAVWITAASIVLIAIVAVCFLTTPQNDPSGEHLHSVATDPAVTTQPATQTPSTDVTVPSTPTATAPTEPSATVPTEPTEPSTEVPSTAPTEPSTEVPTQPTAPVETRPPETEPQPTTPPTPSGGDSSQVTGNIPSNIQNADSAPAADTETHTHSYKTVTYGPYCDGVGYDEHTCTCGHTYYDNLTSAKGHNWEFSYERAVSDYQDGATVYKCTRCMNLKFENVVPAYYKAYDMDRVDTKATDYAGSYGFQTAENGVNATADVFKFTQDAMNVRVDGGEAYLLSKAKSLVDDAYRFCKENNYSISRSIIWVNVSYNKTFRDFDIRVYCAGSL